MFSESKLVEFKIQKVENEVKSSLLETTHEVSILREVFHHLECNFRPRSHSRQRIDYRERSYHERRKYH